MDVGKRIKDRRKELGLSAERVAEIMGVSPSTVYRYESQEIKGMSIEKIKPIAKALQTTPGYLMGWSEDPAVNLVTHTVALSETIHTAQQVASTLAGTEGFDSETLTHPNVERVLSVAKQATAAELLDATDYLEFQIKKRK